MPQKDFSFYLLKSILWLVLFKWEMSIFYQLLTGGEQLRPWDLR